MANTRAIGAISEVLQILLSDGGQSVSMLPPDKMNGVGDASLNLYLYQVERSGRWQNLPRPNTKEVSGPSQLALILRYVLSAYGDDEAAAQDAFETALSLLADSALITKDFIQRIVPDSALRRQLEPVRVTILNIEPRELFHLWSTFQAPYRTSILVEVDVVLIESSVPTLTFIPVLKRGSDDQGPSADVGLAAPFPTLSSVSPPTGVQLGEKLTISGQKLGAVTSMQLTPIPADPAFEVVEIDVAVADRNDTSITVTIDPADDRWRTGMYQVVSFSPDVDGTLSFLRESNSIPVQLVPRIDSVAVNGAAPVADPGPPAAAPRIAVTAQGTGREVDLQIKLAPPVGGSQIVTLLLNGATYPMDPLPAGTATADAMTFRVMNIASGEYWVRVRVDGVDTRYIDPSSASPSFRAFRLEVT